MGSYFVGGLGDGLVQGFNAVEQWKRNREESERTKKLDERQTQLDQQNEGYRNAVLGLQGKQFGLAQAKQTSDQASEQTRLGILSDSLGLDKRRVGLAEAQLPLEQQRLDQSAAMDKARLGLLQNANQRENQDQWYQNQDNALKLKETQRVAGLKHAQDVLYPKLMAGTFSPEDADKWKEVTGLDLRDVIDNNKVDQAVNTFNGLKAGKVAPDDPRVKQSADWLYGNYLQRGIGETMHPVDESGKPLGPDIIRTHKEWGGAFQLPDGSMGLHVIVTGKDAQGNEHRYQSQVSKFGTDDPRDPVQGFSGTDFEKPLAAAMHMNNAFNSDPDLRATVERSLDMSRDNKDQLEGEKLKAEVGKLKAEAGKTQAETGQIATGGKEHEDRMKDVRALANERFGGKYDPTTGNTVGGDTAAWEATISGADKLLRENPKLSSAEAFGKANDSYKTAYQTKTANDIRAKFKAGDLSEKEAVEQLKKLGFE